MHEADDPQKPKWLSVRVSAGLMLLFLSLAHFGILEYRVRVLDAVVEAAKANHTLRNEEALRTARPEWIVDPAIGSILFTSGFVLAIALPILAIIAFRFWPPWIPGRELEPEGTLFWLIPPPSALAILLVSLGQASDDRGLYTQIQENRMKAFHSAVEFAEYAPAPPRGAPSQIDATTHFRPSHALMIELENSSEPPPPNYENLNPSRLSSISFVCRAGEGPKDDADVDILILDTGGTRTEHADYGPAGKYVPDKVVGVDAATYVTFVSIYDAHTKKLLAGAEFSGSSPTLPYSIDPDKQPRSLTGGYGSRQGVHSWISKALRVPDYESADCASVPR
jgi:hypothetical protein